MDQVEQVPDMFPEDISEVTLEDIATRMDMFGEQMNWLCENMQGLFAFITQIGNSGGGIRGLMSAMKQAPPQLHEQEGA